MGRSVRRRGGRVVLAAWLLAGAVLTGCEEDPEPLTPAPPGPVTLPEPPAEPDPPADPVPPVEPAPAGPATAGGCPDSHPRPTTLTPIAPEFTELVAQLTACTDEASGSLHLENRSLVVWELVQPQYPPVTEVTGDPKLDTFRFVMSQRPPTFRLLEPEQEVSFPLADGFLVLPEDAATAVWHTLMATETVTVNHALGSVADELGSGAPGRKVAADCGLAAFDAVRTITSLEELEQKRQQAPALYALDIFGQATGAGGCADSVRSWQQTRQPAGPAFSDELTRAISETQQASSFDDVVRYVLLASPRG